MNLQTQIKELEANVIATAPDKNKQKELEKTLAGYKKGMFCGEGFLDTNCSHMHLLIQE